MRFSNFLFCFAAVLGLSGNAFAVWPNGYTYQGAITIQHAKVPNTDQTNFPVLLAGNFSELATVSSGGRVTNTSGYDIIFASDVNGLNRLNFERQSYSPNGDVVFWVQVPNVSHINDTVFYVFYGNPGISTDQSNPGGTWDGNYLGVWHLEDNPAAAAPQEPDSTSNGHNLTDSGQWFANQVVPGQIGKAILSQAYNYGFTAANNSSLSPGNAMTAEAWININYGGIPTIMEQYDQSGLGAGYVVYMNGLANSIRLKLTAGNNGGLPQRTFENVGGPNINDGRWHHVAVTYQSGSSPIIYLDGAPVPIQAYVNGQLQPAATTIYSGNINAPTTPFYMIPLPTNDYTYPYFGTLDEARMSNVARSGDWIATQYNMETDQANFYGFVWGLTAGGLPPGLAVSPLSLSYSGSTIANPPAQPIAISNSGGAILTWKATSNSPWIKLSTTPNGAGTTTINGNGAQTLYVQVSSTILPAGITSGSITVNAPGANPATQTVNVGLNNSVPAGYWSNGYAFAGSFTVPSSQVPNTDQTNFPVLVSGAYPALASVANGGKVNSPNGYDLIFTSDAAGLNRLNYERELYSPSGQVAFWVQVPLLSHTTNTTFYVFYGNPAGTTDLSNPTAVWDGNYLGVWHLNSNPAGSAPQEADSTTKGHSLTSSGTWSSANLISGQIGNAINGTYSANGFSAANPTSLSPTTAFTLSAWIQINNGGLPTIINQFSTFGAGAGYSLVMDGTSSEVRITMSAGSNGGSLQSTFQTSGAKVNDGKWHYVTATYTSGPGVKFYVDGNLIPAAGNTAFTGSVASTAPFTLIPFQSYYWVGNIDETRVSNIVRSADWTATEYRNQSNPNTFYSTVFNLIPTPTTPALSVTPASLSFAGTTTTNPAARSFAISNAGVGTLNWTASSNQPWMLLSTTPNGVGASTISGTDAQTVYVQVTSAGQSTGSLSGSVSINAPGATPSSQTVSVSLTVTLPPGLSVTPTSLTYAGTTVTNPAAQPIAIANSGSGTLNWSISSNQPWLTVSTTPNGAGSGTLSGTGAQTVYVQVASNTLAAGPYTGALSISAPGATPSSQTVNVSVTVTTPPPGLAVTPVVLVYTGLTNADPAAQSFAISNSGAGTLNWSASSNQPWLKIATSSNGAGSSTLSGTGAQTLWAQVTSNGLAAGSYSAAITLTAPGASPSTQTVNISLTVTPPQGPSTNFLTGFALNSPSLRNDFASFVGMKLTVGANPLNVVSLGRVCVAGNSQTHTVKLVNAATAADVPSGSVPVNMTGCTAGQFVFSTVAVTLPAGGNYYLVSQEFSGGDRWYNYGTVSSTAVASVAGSVYLLGGSWNEVNVPNTSYVPVNLQYGGAAPPTPGLAVTPTTLTFAGTTATNPAAQPFAISNSGGGTLNWTATASQPWMALSLTPNGVGTNSLSGTGAQTIYVQVASNTLAAGPYSGSVSITAPGATPSSQTVSVGLTVTAVAVTPGLAVSPTSLSFTGTTATNPAAQSFAISNSGVGTLNWTATANDAWISLATTANGAGTNSLSGTGPQTLYVQAASNTLAAGTYTGSITVNAPGATPSSQTVSVSLTVTPPLGSGTSFVTGFALNGPSLRNDFASFVGMKLTVGSSPLSVSALGRVCVAGNSQTHTVKLVSAANFTDVPNGTAQVNMNGCTPGQFVFAGVTVTLPAGGSYYLASQEFSGGDRWYNYGTVSTTNVASVNGSVYLFGGSWNEVNIPNTSYVPVNLQYGAAAPPSPALAVAPTSLTYSGTTAANPAAQSFAISNAGGGTLNWTATANAAWISLSTTPNGAGSNSLSGSGGQIIYVQVASNTLAAGPYSGTVSISAPGATPSSQTVNVALTVTAVPTTPVLAVTPTSLSLTGSTTTNPVAQSFAISNAGIGTLNWTATANAPWISLSTTANGAGSSTLSGTGAQTLYVQAASNTLAAGTYSGTVSVDAPGATPSSQPVSVSLTVNPPQGAATSFLTGFALNGPTLRNDFGSFVGMKFTVGANALNVSSLGRVCVAGNSQTHTVKLVNAATKADVASGSVQVNMAGCTPGQFVFASVTVTLPAGGNYYLASQEFAGGDRWYNYGTVSSTNVAAVTGSVYLLGGSWSEVNTPNTSYVPVNFQYGSTTASLAVTPTSLAYSGTTTTNPATQTFVIANNGGGTLNWIATASQPWISLSTTANGSGSSSLAGSGTQTIYVAAASNTLAAGPYTGTVGITASGASPPSQSVSVSLTVSPPAPSLTVTPTSLSFSGSTAVNPATQSFAISNSGAGTLNWTATASQPWISLSTTPNGAGSTSLSGTGPQIVYVQAASTTLAAGPYSGSVAISAPGATPSAQTVAVSLTVASVPPALAVTPTNLTYSGSTAANPASQSFAISNSGGGTLNWTATASQPWISLSTTPNGAGSNSLSGAGPQTVYVQVASNTLAAGPYAGSVAISAPGATPSSQVVNISLTVTAVVPPPGLAVTPLTLTFSGTTTTNPSLQSFAISNSGGGTLSWTATASQPWMTLSTTPNGSGTSSLSGTGAQTIYLLVASNTLAAGPYAGTIGVSAPGAAPASQTVNVGLTVTAPAPGNGAWPNGYGYRGRIAVDHTKVPNTDQTNFAVLVSGLYSELASLANGGNVTSANGYDIIFTADPSGLIPLKFELESYSPSGQVSFWVKLPTVSHSADTTFYVFYGNGAVSADQSTRAATWDSNYFGVWHLGGNPAGTAPQEADATGNAHNLTASGPWTSGNLINGQISGGISSSSFYNGFAAANPASLTPSTAFTLSSWINVNNGGLPTLINQFDTTGGGAGYNFVMNGANNRLRLTMSAANNGGSPSTTFETGTVNINDGNWHYVGATYLSGSGVMFYVDGTPEPAIGNASFGGSIANSSTFSLIPFSSYYYVGSIDESRVSNIARSADWVATEYNNQKNPQTFYSATWGSTARFAAPNGTPGGNGSLAQPLDLQTALNQGGGIQAGDVVWLRGGNYGNAPTVYTATLNGSPTAPIIIRQYPGERATVNGGIQVTGTYTWFWGFEVTNLSNPERVLNIPGSDVYSQPGGFDDYGIGNKFINLAIHDTAQGIGFWTASGTGEIYGSLIYNNGWQGSDRGHGHGIYTQNQTGFKTIADNVIFQGFGLGIQAYGSSNAFIDNYSFDGNTIFNAGTLSNGNHDYNLLIAGGAGPHNISVTNNYTYHRPGDGTGLSSLDWPNGGVPSGSQNLTATGNYWIGGQSAIQVFSWVGATFTNNTAYSQGGSLLVAGILSPGTYTWDNNAYFGSDFVNLDGSQIRFADWQAQSGLDQNSTRSLNRPTGTWSFVRPNKYESGRANITIYNWDLAGTVPVNLSNVLTIGRAYKILNAQDVFGTPVATGTYTGGTVDIPMTGLTAAPALGHVPVQPNAAGPEFGAFVVLQ